MTLKTQMAADLASVFINSSEFAETGLYQAEGGSTTFSLTGTPGDANPASKQADGGEQQQGTATVTFLKSAFDTGMTAVGLTGKLPVRGDTWTVASGPLAGKWRLDTYDTDIGGALILNLTRSDWSHVGLADTRGT